MRDYNAQRHWTHEKHEDGKHSPAAVLGGQIGHGAARSYTFLHLVEKPQIDQQTEE